MENPLISFIIPTCDTPPGLLRSCIGSIAALPLTPAEREIIVVDDGSIVPAEKATEGMDVEIRHIRQPNAGPGAARNAGMDAAMGAYLQFVDSDDCLLPAYAACIGVAREGVHDMALFGYSHTAVDTGEAVWSRPRSGACYMAKHNIRGMACTYMFKRETAGGLRFPGLARHEDEVFAPLLTIRAKSLVATKAKAYLYKIREGSQVYGSGGKRTDLELARRAISMLAGEAANMGGMAHKAVRRRTDQLSMDHIYNAMRQGGPAAAEEETAWLKSRGLFPLRPAPHTAAYLLFAVATRSKAARRLMAKLLSR